MTRNVMLAFISLVNPRSIESPVEYPDLMGEPYTAVQTNEAPVVYMQRLLKENQLDSLFLIASGKVRTENVPEGSEFGDVTHLEFFEKRILRLYPALEGHFLSIDYDDATDHLETSLHDVTQVAKRIFSYIQQYPDDHIVVHADMTGGMRHVSMMMLSVMQMLKYRGVEIGEVIYADPFHHQVYPATPIQRMFDLINGADEFVKFGSVRGIREYFDGLPHNGQDDSPELRELLQAMGRFSDAIQICRTGLILEEIQNLGKRLEAFHAHEPKTLPEELLDQLTDAIRKDYGKLLTDTVSPLDIIRWCMKKNFWQQALTLCTEWIPAYLIGHRIAYTEDDSVRAYCQAQGEAGFRTWEQYFIINYSGGQLTVNEATGWTPKKLRHWMEGVSMNALPLDDLSDMPQLRSRLADLAAARDAYEKLRAGSISVRDLASEHPACKDMVQTLYDESTKKMNGASFSRFYRNLPYSDILLRYSKLSSRAIDQLLQLDIQKEPETAFTIRIPAAPKSKWEARRSIYEQLYELGVLKTDCATKDEMMDFLHDYHSLRDERNQVNHANREHQKPITEIAKQIHAILDRLEKAVQK